MANLNIRNFPADVLHDLNGQAERAGMTLRGYVIKRLTSERGIAAGAPVFQTGDAGSTPAVRSIPTYPDRADSVGGATDYFDYSDVPYDDCPPEEKKRRREVALAKRGIGGKP